MFNEMLDEVIIEGTADLPSLFEVNDAGGIFLVNTAAPRPQGDQ